MDSLKLSLCRTIWFLALGFVDLASPDSSIDIRVKVGEDAVLQCQVPVTGELRVLEWTRLGLSDYVFYYRDGRLNENFQNPSYRGRVKLRDPQMTTGDRTIILSNTTPKDEGTYTCKVIMDTEATKTIQLSVEQNDEPEQEGNNLGLKVGLPVGLLAAAALIGGFFYVRSKSGEDAL